MDLTCLAKHSAKLVSVERIPMQVVQRPAALLCVPIVVQASIQVKRQATVQLSAKLVKRALTIYNKVRESCFDVYMLVVLLFYKTSVKLQHRSKYKHTCTDLVLTIILYFSFTPFDTGAGHRSLCRECESGRYSVSEGRSTICDACVGGKFKKGTKSTSPCTKCPSGWSQPLANQSSCDMCLPGT
jgi:hypothetical protein